MNIDINSRP